MFQLNKLITVIIVSVLIVLDVSSTNWENCYD